MNKKTYKTDIGEVNRALELADNNKKIIFEDDKKAVVMVELSKEQVKKLKEVKKH